MNAIDLNRRIALLTGGGGGIGRAVAERFAASGATVIVWDLSGPADERVDVTDEAAVTAAMQRLLARHGAAADLPPLHRLRRRQLLQGRTPAEEGCNPVEG